jgi:hypothetical protein
MLIATRNFSIAQIARASSSLTVARLHTEPMASNISRTVALMERIRVRLGNRPVFLHSLARTPEHLDYDSETSAHLPGLAADFSVEGMTPDEVMAILAPEARALGIDQLILYGDHVHASADPRERAQTLDARFGNPLRQYFGPSLAMKPNPDGTGTTPNAQVASSDPHRIAIPGCGTYVAIFTVGTVGAGLLSLWM